MYVCARVCEVGGYGCGVGAHDVRGWGWMTTVCVCVYVFVSLFVCAYVCIMCVYVCLCVCECVVCGCQPMIFMNEGWQLWLRYWGGW